MPNNEIRLSYLLLETSKLSQRLLLMGVDIYDLVRNILLQFKNLDFMDSHFRAKG